MRIGDIEYTRRLVGSTAVANSSVRVATSFALGIKVRPLLTRVQVWPFDAGAGTGGQAVFFENAQDVATALTIATLRDDARLHPIYVNDQALSTNGLAQVVGFESTWWKILMPDMRIHFVSSVLASWSAVVNLHYRFVELTDDEIIEIAAQRAQS